METKSVFLLNPCIKESKKIYIWGTDRDAAELFMDLCTRRVYINGFIDNQNVGILFFHKPVYAETEVELSEEDIILSKDTDIECDIHKICNQIYILNPGLYGKKAIIYDAGYNGKMAYSILQRQYYCKGGGRNYRLLKS